MRLLTENGKPTKALTIALSLHLIFLLCAGFLALPKKEKPEEYLFEMVSAPPPMDTPQQDLPQPVEEPPPPPEPEPEPEVTPEPEPKVTPEPPPPEPEPPAPKPTPKPKPLVKKDPPKPKILKKAPEPKPAPVKKVAPKPTPKPTPKPVSTPQIKVNTPTRSPIRTPSQAPVRPVAPPPVSQADLNQYLGLYQRLFLRYWQRPPQGFLANKEVLLQFTISPQGRLLAFQLVRPSGDSQLDNSILSALNSIRSRGELIPPPGGQTRTFQLAFTPS
jgi:TonB family protein